MKPLTFKLTSDHFLLFVSLSLLWGVTDSTTTAAAATSTTETKTTTIMSTASPTTTAAQTSTTEIKTTTIMSTASPTTKSPPENVNNVTVETQSESNITLRWTKVANIATYFLRYRNNNNPHEEPIDGGEGPSVRHVVTSLTAGTKYNFTLITTSEGLNSTGYSFSAVTAPRNAGNFTSVGQNETSITLQWNKVGTILNYVLVLNGKETPVVAKMGEETVTHTVLGLTNKTQYNFTLFVVFENVSSTGVKTIAYTAPPNAEGFKSVGQNETSITLRWNKVDGILTYMLNGDMIPVAAGEEAGQVTHTVSELQSATKYNFTLHAVFQNITSTGVTLSAVTAPGNAGGFISTEQNETSITLQWNKVGTILNYILVLNGGETPVVAKMGEETVTHTVLGLTNKTQYNFTLFVVFENVSSTGVNTIAYTAPPNAEGFKSVGQNETSITLRWNKVDGILTYMLNGDMIPVAAGEEAGQVTHTVSELQSATKYNFTLHAVFQNITSTGVTLSAVTAPGNAGGFISAEQNESSITLQWNKVGTILNYILVLNGGETPVVAKMGEETVTHTVLGLTNKTQYNFTLFVVFENVSSTGVNTIAYTAPPNAEGFKSIGQNETSITLRWNKVDGILTYMLNGDMIPVAAGEEAGQVTHTVSELQSATKYDLTLHAVFQNITSTGVTLSAVTAPGNAGGFISAEQNETSITLQWNKVGNILNYALVYNETQINVTASASQVKHQITGLTSATKYVFTLYTVFEGVRSTGVNHSAATAPRNAGDFKSVGQNETSITLQWNKLDGILNYILVLGENEIHVTASEGTEVMHPIEGLRPGTKYIFTLYTVFEGVNSSGVNHSAATAPRNAGDFKSVEQNETSITLQWTKQDDNILNYILVLGGEEINITASEGPQVRHGIPGLTPGSKYIFTLYTVFEDIRSSGVTHSAATAPRNTEGVETVDQNETSIILQWNKVDNILNYTLKLYEKVINVTASEGQEKVTHTVLELISATKYNFSLYTVFENIKSSGVKHSAVTAPGNVNNVTVLTQNESSITLKWDKVQSISSYFLQYDNKGRSVLVLGNAFYQEASVTHEVSLLNAGTKYNFTLITLFEKVNSTGFSFNAATVPPKVASVKTDRHVDSIKLTWQQMNNDWDYSLQINGEISHMPTNRAQGDVTHTVTSLQPGTEYPFSVITMFSGLNSTAYENFTVTTIDCTKATWQVTNSSIQGEIEGLFSTATATNDSFSHSVASQKTSGKVSFDNLYPGATYKVDLVYEKNSRRFHQCNHTLTIIPPYMTAQCKYWKAGYSVFIDLDEPDGVWTYVEVTMRGGQHNITKVMEQHLEISGFQPAQSYQVSLVSVSGDVRSDAPFVFICYTDPRGVIAGSVIAVLLIGVLVCLAAFIYFKRPTIVSKKMPFIGGANKKSKTISVAMFPEHVHQLSVDENRGFSEEYESLFPVGKGQPQMAALLPENKVRNRFNNVLPYDWSRVKLLSGASDYINACYMPGYNSSREYIATQGPLPSTVEDFWRMVWDQRVKGIVMVTNCTENGKTKCHHYWPADSKPCRYGELTVTMPSQQQGTNWMLREFRVKHVNHSEERTVKHFHFTAWPDHGVPLGTEALIQFRGLMRQHINEEGTGAPTVVHCSAGVGRTGTIIALDVLLQQLEKEKAVGINSFVHKMRMSRPHMVQTESQYVFLHQCIMDYLQRDGNDEENIYENDDMIYVNATALRELHPK